MNEIWYVDEGEGFHLVVDKDRSRAIRTMFPEESQDLRHARIYCKEVVSFKEVLLNRPKTCSSTCQSRT
jgi:hypothetical protein